MFKITSHKQYIEINSPLITWYSKLTGTRWTAKAGAFYPFILTSPAFNSLPDKEKSVLINHELIHFAQQRESLYIGLLVLNIAEMISLILRHPKSTSLDRYLMKSFEQEAYLNMFNPDYLKTRKPFAHFAFLRNKPVDNAWLEANYPEFNSTDDVTL